MITKISLFKKVLLAVSVFALGLAFIPVSGASAAGLNDDTNPPASVQSAVTRLERAWKHQQFVFTRQGRLLDKADEFIARVQTAIDKANEKGWDTSLVQVALDAFASVVPLAKSAHVEGVEIIASHAGFDGNGKVTDRVLAAATVKSLTLVIRNTRSAINGTGMALREAIREFRQLHKPVPQPGN